MKKIITTPFKIDDTALDTLHSIVIYNTAEYTNKEYIGAIFQSKNTVSGINLDIKVSTSAIRSSFLYLPIFLSDDVEVSISCQGRVIHHEPVNIEEETGCYLHIVSFEITEYTEKEFVTDIHVQISYKNANTLIQIPDSTTNVELRPHVIQKQDIKIAISYISYLILLILLLIGAGIIIYGKYVPVEYEKFNQIIVSLIVLVISLFVLPLLKLDYLVKISRSIYSKFRWHRKHLFFILIITTVFSNMYGYKIMDCLYVRQQYSEFLQKYQDTSDDKYLINALSLFPSRIEAQQLINMHIYLRRKVESKEPIEQYIAELDSNKKIKNILQKDDNDLCERCVKDLNYIRDPRLWFATLLPEAEANSSSVYKRKALELLIQNKDNASLLLSKVIEYDLLEKKYDDAKNDTCRDEIAELMIKNITTLKKVNDQLNSVQMNLHIHQEAYDRIGQYYFKYGKNVSEAILSFKEVIETRIKYSGKLPFWDRSPLKLGLYHFIISFQSSRKDSNAEFSRKILNQHPIFKKEFENTFIKEERYEKYRKEQKWYEGTLIQRESTHDQFAIVMNNYVNKGWEY